MNYTITVAPANGTLYLSGVALAATENFTQDDIDNDRVTYDHDGSENFLDSFDFDVDDGSGAASSGSFAISVTPVNDAPTATNMDVTVLYVEDTPLDLTDITISDVDSPNVTATLTLSDISAGVLSTATSGLVTSTFVADVWTASGAIADVDTLLSGVFFTPALNYNSPFSIATSVEDGVAAPITNVITVNSTPVNDAPTISAAAGYGVNEDDGYRPLGSISISDVDASSGDIQVTVSVSHGILFTGTTAGLTSITGNDSASITLVGALADINGSLAAIGYRPDPDHSGSDTLSIGVDDLGNTGTGGSQTANTNVPITINPVNDEQVLAVNTGTTVTEGGTGNVITAAMLETTDVDNAADQLIYTVTTAPANGTLYLSGVALAASHTFTQDDIDNGRITYEHDDSENLTDSFAFSVDDGAGTASTGTFSITITPVSDNDPVADDESFTVAEGGTATQADLDAGTSLLDGDTDADLPGDTLTVTTTPVVDVSHGTLTLNADGTFSYVHDGTENFTDSFTYQVSDGAGGTATATVTITITPVGDDPVFQNTGPFNVDEGASAGTTVGDIDADDGDGGAIDAGITYTITGNLDPDGDLNDAFAIDSNTGVITVNDADDLDYENASSMVITVEADDGANTQSSAVTIDIDDVTPTLSANGAATIREGELYTLNLTAVEPGTDSISSWIINWGDGAIETIAGNPTQATHVFTNAGFTNNITVSAMGEGDTVYYLHNDLFAGHYVDDAGVYRIQGNWGAAPVEFATEGTLDKTIQPVIGPDGNLYVSGESSKNVLRYDTGTGAFIDVFANIPGDAGGIAFGPDGHLYVADYTNRDILRFNGSDGSAMGAFVTGTGGRPYG